MRGSDGRGADGRGGPPRPLSPPFARVARPDGVGRRPASARPARGRARRRARSGGLHRSAVGRLAGLPVPPRRGFPRSGFGLPNLRRNVCPHFYMTGARGAIPIQAPAPAQGTRSPGRERVALPAAGRRPSRAGLRQRRLPVRALQPVRLLRGSTWERDRGRPGDVRGGGGRPPGPRPVRRTSRAGSARERSCGRSATRSEPSPAPWSVAPTGRGASSP